MRKLLVVGDAMLDHYVRVERRPAECLSQVVRVVGNDYVPGGAANVAANAAGLGCDATLLAAVGDDEPGRLLLYALDEAGVAWAGFTHPVRRTTVKRRFRTEYSQLLRVDDESAVDVRAPAGDGLVADWFRDRVATQLPQGHDKVLVISDYGKGFCTPTGTGTLAREQGGQNTPVLIDVSDSTRWGSHGSRNALFKVNLDAAVRFLRAGHGADADVMFPWLTSLHSAESNHEKLFNAVREELAFDHVKYRYLWLTLGAGGSIVGSNPHSVFDDDPEPVALRVRRAEVADPIGAGDAALAVLAWHVCCKGYDWTNVVEGVRLAGDAAAVAVTRAGTCRVRPDDLPLAALAHSPAYRHARESQGVTS